MLSNRKETTQCLSKMLEKHLNPNNDARIYTAAEVTFDYSSKPVRVDYMLFKPINNSIGGIENGSFYCYEIKSCKDDFTSGHGLNFIGDFNYIVMPQQVYEDCKTLIPYYVGVYVPSSDVYKPLRCIKKAKKMVRKKSVTEMLLMMFRSSNRELLKQRS